MQILIDFKLEQHLEDLLISDNIIYRPDLQTKGRRFLRKALSLAQPHVLMTRQLPEEDTISDWKIKDSHQSNFIILITSSEKLLSKTIEKIADIPIYYVSEEIENYPEIQALSLAEEINRKNLADSIYKSLLSHLPKNSENQQKIAIVGAGIVNLVTAYYFLQEGYKISLFDASSDPRLPTENWRKFGCTYGGNDARMFTLSEAYHHLNLGYIVNQNMNRQFHLGINKGGWLCCYPKKLTEIDQAWISNYETIPAWLPSIFNDEIISFNQESLPLWDTLKQNEPELFVNTGYIPKVLRLYSTPQQFYQAIQTEEKIGSKIREIDLNVLQEKYPALKEAILSGEIVGALEVVGFTVNIHKFSHKLLNRLQELGAEINWNYKIDRIERNSENIVTGLKSQNRSIKADHYLISPGAYGNILLTGTDSENMIASVLGMWLQLPNIEPKLDVSLKISRRGYASDSAAQGANIIVGTDSEGKPIINVSSGHGYLGENPHNISTEHLNNLFRVVEETAQYYFPKSYQVAKEKGIIESSLRYCVRPWTASGLGLFEVIQAENNGILMITGGHNTGGFAQSPSIAKAVCSALRGQEHPMHQVYHPRRLSSFLR